MNELLVEFHCDNGQKSITNKSPGSDRNNNEETPYWAVLAPGTRPHLQSTFVGSLSVYFLSFLSSPSSVTVVIPFPRPTLF